MAGARTVSRARLADYDPFKGMWRLLTSVRFALALIAYLALAAAAGIAIPQLPAEMRANPAAVTAWLAFQEERFGSLTPVMHQLGLFELFRSPWFVAGLALLVISVCVCTVNRLSPVWRNVTRPQVRVPDEYFERGQPVIDVEAGDVRKLSDELRRRRYRVLVEQEAGATYLFADRFPWAQMATFVSHLALILFLAGGLVTLIAAKEQMIFVAEGEAGAPVFGLTDRDHMQVFVEDAIGRFDDSGFPLDFRTAIVVYKDGREVARGETTVNSPLSYGGFRFHQSAYFPDGAALRVREVASGRTVYDEVLALTSTAATPSVVFRDAGGTLLLEELVVPTDFIGDVGGTLLSVPGGRQFWVGARPGGAEGWQLIAFETTPEASRAVLYEGQQASLGGLTLSFEGLSAAPSSRVGPSLPGVQTEAVAELARGASGPRLVIGPVEGRALALAPGEPVVAGGYEYIFLGTREFAGLTVRRDPGSTFIWVATAVFLAGLALTFYTPRRRLWGKIVAGKASFRGLGGRSFAIEREIREAAARAAQKA